eukprot:m.206228 g.206228  ORF g.206228 m.206228 type:complete len:678 (+) comp32947_c3_seq1:170-2203(+)
MMLDTLIFLSLIARVSAQLCSVGIQSEEKYEPSFLVDRYSPYAYAEFPTEKDDMVDYLAKAAGGLIALIVCGLIICCICDCLNCWVCRKLQREEKRFVEMVQKRQKMTEQDIEIEEQQMDYCHNLPYLRHYSFRQYAYFALFVLFCGAAALTGLAVYIEPDQTNAVNDLPKVLIEAQSHISDSMIPAINCTIGELDDIDLQTDFLNISTNASDYAYVSTIKAATETVRDPLLRAIESLVEISDLAKENEDWVRPITDDLASANTWLVRVLFGVLFIVAFIAIVVAWQAGKVTHHTAQNWQDAVAETTGQKHNKATAQKKVRALTCFSHFFMFMAFIAFIAAGVYNFFTVASAGFCKNPEEVLIRYTQSQNATDTDQRMQYYAKCKSYSLSEEEENWIWKTEKEESGVAFETVLAAANALRAGHDVSTLYTTIENTRDTTVGVLGTLSEDGLLGCPQFEYFYELVANDFCTRWFFPTARIQELLVLYCLCFILIEVTLFIMRREEPDYDIYHQDHDEADDGTEDGTKQRTPKTGIPRGHKKLTHQQRASVKRQLDALKTSNSNLAKAAMTVAVGDRVQVDGYPGYGVVRYTGLHKQDAGKGFRVGVEFQDAIGKNDGLVGGQRYFKCKNLHGVLVVPRKVCRVVVDTQQGHPNRAMAPRPVEMSTMLSSSDVVRVSHI